MEFIEILAIIAFLGLLGASIFMVVSFYVCDNFTCKPFVTASNAGPTGSQDYVLSVLNEFATDGIWPLPYIGAAILTPISLWFLKFPITVFTFSVMFFVSFTITYFLFSFYNHHYIHFISEYTANYIRNSCTGGATSDNITLNTTENVEPQETPPETFADQLGVTFVAPTDIPVNTFVTPVNTF